MDTNGRTMSPRRVPCFSLIILSYFLCRFLLNSLNSRTRCVSCDCGFAILGLVSVSLRCSSKHGGNFNSVEAKAASLGDDSLLQALVFCLPASNPRTWRVYETVSLRLYESILGVGASGEGGKGVKRFLYFFLPFFLWHLGTSVASNPTAQGKATSTLINVTVQR